VPYDNLLQKFATAIIVAQCQYEILQIFSEVVARYGFKIEPRALRGIFLSISIKSYHTYSIDMNMEKAIMKKKIPKRRKDSEERKINNVCVNHEK